MAGVSLQGQYYSGHVHHCCHNTWYWSCGPLQISRSYSHNSVSIEELARKFWKHFNRTHSNNSLPGFKFISKTFQTFIKNWPRNILSVGNWFKWFLFFFKIVSFLYLLIFLFSTYTARREYYISTNNTWHIFKRLLPRSVWSGPLWEFMGKLQMWGPYMT